MSSSLASLYLFHSSQSVNKPRIVYKRKTKQNKNPALFSRSVMVQLFVTPWAVVCQVPRPMQFSRQEYWSRLPFPPLSLSLSLSLSLYIYIYTHTYTHTYIYICMFVYIFLHIHTHKYICCSVAK